MTRDEQAMQFLDSYKKLEKDPDKSKILSVNALLGYDDGGDYTERDYQRAIAFLEEGLETVGDTADGFIAKAVAWCKTRSQQLQSV